MTIEHNDFERELEQQASMFSMQAGRENERAVRTYIVADFEYAYDHSRYAGYCVSEGADAKDKLRWPFHTIAAASWTVMRFRPGAELADIEPPVVMSSRDYTAAEMTAAFLEAVACEPTACVTTWGGEYKDLAVLRRTAMGLGLVLPVQIADPSPYSRLRIDLCDAVSVRADSASLPEYAAACSIPAKPSPAKSVGKLVQNGNWAKVEEQCLADVLTTSVIMIRYLVSHGQIICDQNVNLMALAEAAASVMPDSKFAQHTFRSWARALTASSKLRGKVYRAEDQPVQLSMGRSLGFM